MKPIYVFQNELLGGYLKGLKAHLDAFTRFLGDKKFFIGNSVSCDQNDNLCTYSTSSNRSDAGDSGRFMWYFAFCILQVTFVDFVMYELLDQHKFLFKDSLQGYDKLNAFLDRFEVRFDLSVSFYIKNPFSP